MPYVRLRVKRVTRTGLFDEAYYPLGSPNKSFDSLINVHLRVFQNHRKQAKIDIVFIISLGLRGPPQF